MHLPSEARSAYSGQFSLFSQCIAGCCRSTCRRV